MSDIIEIGENDLADMFGVSTRRIRQMVKEGVVIKVKPGKYDLKASTQNYIQGFKDREKQKDQSLEKLKQANEAEKLMHERLKKRKTELQVLTLEKKLHRSEDVEFFWNNMILAAKSRLTAIPVKAAPLLVGIEDRKEIQTILKRHVTEALNELADYDIDQFESEIDIDEDE